MHETGKWYRLYGEHLRIERGYAVLCLLAMLVPSLVLAQGQTEEGRALYTRYCVRCHGEDGRGGPMVSMLPVSPRNLADPAYMQTRTAEQLFEVIKGGGSTQGLSATMPGFGKQLSDAQVWDTVAYVRTLAGAASTARSQPDSTASAASDVMGLQRLNLSIWPEYDDPRVLVIVRGELSPESRVPTQIRLPIPKEAELLGAGMISPQNEPLNHPHERLSGDVSDTLELNLPVHRFFAEWYYDPFDQRQSARQFTYSLTLPYAVAELYVDILEPDAATDFRIAPAPSREEVDTRGGKHHLFSYQDLEPEAKLTYEVTYVKTTDAPSIAKSPTPSFDSQPGTPQASGLSRSTKTWVAFAMLAGFTAIFAVGVLVFRNQPPASPPAATTVSTSSSPAQHATPEEESDSTQIPGVTRQNYCSNCGRQLQVTYAFCPGCGRPLQTP